MKKKVETVEEFLARGGEVKTLRPSGINARWHRWNEDEPKESKTTIEDNLTEENKNECNY